MILIINLLIENGFMQIIRDVQDVIGAMLPGGVFERHPGLKMVSAGADAGWMPHWSYPLDHAANLSQAERKAILRDNVRELFQLPVPAA